MNYNRPPDEVEIDDKDICLTWFLEDKKAFSITIINNSKIVGILSPWNSESPPWSVDISKINEL